MSNLKKGTYEVKIVSVFNGFILYIDGNEFIAKNLEEVITLLHATWDNKKTIW